MNEVEQDEPQRHWEAILTRKAGVEGWRWYQGERIDGGVLYTGCVPNGVYSRGPRKGHPRFQGGTHLKRIVVTDQELQNERLSYSRTTGNCWECYGDGEVTAGWSAESGTRLRPCGKCNGTGKRSGM